MLHTDVYIFKHILTWSLLLLFCQNLLGQAQSVQYWVNEGKKCYDDEMYADAETALVFADQLAKNQENIYGQVQALYWQGETAFDQQAYLRFLDFNFDAKELIESKLNKDTTKIYFTILQNLGVGNSYTGRFDLQRRYYKEALTFAQQAFPTDTTMLANAVSNLSAAYYRTFTIDSAIIWSDSTLALAEKINDTDLQATVHLNRGVIYSNCNDYDQAINRQKKALELTKSTNEKILGHSHLSDYYQVTGQPEKALKHLNKALDFVRDEQRAGQQYQSMVELKACNFYLNEGDTSTFLNIWKNLYQWLPKNDPNFDCDHKNALNLIAEYQIAQKQYTLAEESIQQALITREGQKFPQLETNSLKLYARLLSEQGYYQSALEKIQEGLITITPGMNSSSRPEQIEKNPNPRQILAPEQSLELLLEKMTILMKWAKTTEDEWPLQQAFVIFECVDSFLTINRQQLKSRESRTTLAGLIQPFFHQSVNLFYLLFQKDQDIKWIEQAFRVMERGRALIISEKLIKQYSPNYADQKNELALKEEKLATQYEFLNLLIKQNESRPGLEKEKRQWIAERNLVEKEWVDLLKQYEEISPSYYAQNYQLPFLLPREVRNKLINENEIVLSFLDMDSFVYCIGISQTDLFLKKLPLKQSLATQIKQLRLSLEKRERTYYSQSSSLYTQLLQPIEEIIGNKDIILLPDGWLWKLPFSSLVKSNDTKPTFLIEKNNLRYWHAAHTSLLLQNERSTYSYHYNCTAFAPFCFAEDNNDSRIPPTLPGSLSEINAVEEIFPKHHFRAFCQNEATSKGFLNNINDSQIIHISTHTTINKNDPSLSSLYFHLQNDDEDDGKVDVHDLYQKEIQADLAVLSTCRSADDKIEQGEGLVGLSRIFSMAGCLNVILGQWSVNDKSSSKIMTHFYQNLLAGEGKNKALINAQRNYLNHSDPLEKHPYYWAAFIHIGDNDQIDFTNIEELPNSNLTYLFWMGLVLASLLLWKSRSIFQRFQ